MTHILHESNEWDFDKAGHRGKVFPSVGLVSRSSYLRIDIDGSLDSVLMQTKCDFIYYVIRGNGTFLLGENREPAQQGDLVVIPAGTAYSFMGTMKLLLVCTPPWSEGQERNLGGCPWVK